MGLDPAAIRAVRFRYAIRGGYDPREVDALLERIAIRVEARQSPASLIADAAIGRGHRGYHIRDVNGFLSCLSSGDLDGTSSWTEMPLTWVNKRYRSQNLWTLVVIMVCIVVGVVATGSSPYLLIVPFIVAVLDAARIWAGAPSVTADQSGISVRSGFRTERYPWSQIRRFGVVDSWNRRRYLASELTTGKLRRFKRLGSAPNVWGWPDQVAHSLNTALSGVKP